MRSCAPVPWRGPQASTAVANWPVELEPAPPGRRAQSADRRSRSRNEPGGRPRRPHSHGRAVVHGCPQVPAEMQMTRRRALRRNVGARQIAVARLDRTHEFMTLPRIAVENDRAVAGGRACPLDQGMLPRRRRRRAPGPHAVLRAFPDEGMVMRVPQASNSLGANNSGWCSSGVLGFCCSRIGLGASNTRPLSRPKARVASAGFFLYGPLIPRQCRVEPDTTS